MGKSAGKNHARGGTRRAAWERMQLRPSVALVAIVLGCAAPRAPPVLLTSAVLGPIPGVARMAVPGRVDAFALAASAPDRTDVPGLLRAMADALDDMPQTRDRFAI